MAEVRLVEPPGVRRPVLGTGVGEAGEVHLRLAVRDRDRGPGVLLFRRCRPASNSARRALL